jgi:DNA-binding NarL/FixJ family response regulator
VNGFQRFPTSERRILIVDPDVGQRELAEKLLRRGGWRTEVVASGEEALAAARRELPLIVVVEVRLEGMSGYEVCHELQAEHGDGVGVIFLSHDRTDTFDKEAGLIVGADDYLAKPFAGGELLARILALARRLNALPDRAPTRRGELTPRELEVLRLLCDGLNQAKIAKRLVITPKTVGKHIEHILEKLPASSRAEAVAIAYKRGLHTPSGAVERKRPAR